MRQFDNPNNISQAVARLRIRNADPNAEAEAYEVTRLDGTIARYINVDSSLLDAVIQNLFNQAETAEEQTTITNDLTARQQIKAEYSNMVTRLQQIQNAGAIPFTQAGFNQVVQAVKDEALYIERVMKVIKTLVT
jgi:hypothetical protein